MSILKRKRTFNNVIGGDTNDNYYDDGDGDDDDKYRKVKKHAHSISTFVDVMDAAKSSIIIDDFSLQMISNIMLGVSGLVAAGFAIKKICNLYSYKRKKNKYNFIEMHDDDKMLKQKHDRKLNKEKYIEAINDIL
ncbi:hypothetical protein PV326_013425 [Microctonus aethiopoides]|nr:hypothetical protein PV326_013425 [Microctonus aethiopoides]